MVEVVQQGVGGLLMLLAVGLLCVLALRDLSQVTGGRRVERAVFLVPAALTCLVLGGLLLQG